MIEELIQRYRKRLRELWANPNPYYRKGVFPTEYQDIKQWISKLENKKTIIIADKKSPV